MKIALTAVLAAAILATGCSSGDSSAGPKPWQQRYAGPSLQQGETARAMPSTPGSRREYIAALRDAGIFVPVDAEQAAAEAGEVMCDAMAQGATRRDLLGVVDDAMTGVYTRSERETLVDVSMMMCFIQVG